jgi:hypothetical protein
MMRNGILFATAASVLLICFGSMMAENFSKKGKTYYARVSQEDEELSDGRILRKARSTGHIVFDDGTPGRSQTCFTSTLIEKGMTEWTGGGHCHEVDGDGDLIWIWLKLNHGGNRWGYIQGTGKFNGIAGEGTSRVTKEWPDGNFVVEWQVDYEIP